MVRGRRNAGRERLWRERMARWRASGLSVREFCGRHGLTEPTFHYWKRELRLRDEATAAASSAACIAAAAAVNSTTTAASSATASSERSRPMFVPVTVLPATVAVEVHCPSGHVVCLSAWDVSALASLFAALDPRRLSSVAGEAPSW